MFASIFSPDRVLFVFRAHWPSRNPHHASRSHHPFNLPLCTGRQVRRC